MAFFRSIRTFISRYTRNQSSSSSSPRSFFTLSLSSPLPTGPTPTPYQLPTHSIVRRHFLFRSRFLSPGGGPLFLSNHPWKLSQFATPLLLQSDAILTFVRLRALNLLHRPSLPHDFPRDAPKLLNEGRREEFESRAEAHESFSDHEIIDSYLNLPNFVSFTRMLSAPLLGWMIIHDMYSSAFIGLAIAGATDWLDGYLPRKMRINSVVGSYLDPLADKVLIGCVALAMVEKGLLHPGLAALVVLRDVALVGGAVYKRAGSLNWEWKSWRDFFDLDGAQAQKVEPLFISKVNTVFQLLLVAGALLQPEFGNEDTQLYINYLGWLVASTTVASTAAYGAQHFAKGAALSKSKKLRI